MMTPSTKQAARQTEALTFACPLNLRIVGFPTLVTNLTSGSVKADESSLLPERTDRQQCRALMVQYAGPTGFDIAARRLEVGKLWQLDAFERHFSHSSAANCCGTGEHQHFDRG
ncbi:hypothetical protein ACE10Z_34225 [Bradyrhizobium sp. Pha-3]|uniref:hypothetical protein n=1 Tax=Bradyrhizobium sp. Pha-3 TaxID=208375 RepID=UPI0035D4318F